MNAPRTFKNAVYAHLAQVGKALSSAARLEILDLLAQAPRTVEVLAREIEQSIANTSHHLQTLKRAQLVVGHRSGSHVEYAIAGRDVAQLVVTLQAVAAGHIAGVEQLTRAYFEARDGLDAVDRETLLDKLARDEVVLVDVRPEHEFEAGHVAGAVSIPHNQLESRLAELPRDRTIVAYCRGPFCTFSADAARRLRDHGFDARRTDASVHTLSPMEERPR